MKLHDCAVLFLVTCVAPLTLTVIGKPDKHASTAQQLSPETGRVKRSDDLGLTDLQALVQQQAQVIQSLQSQQAADQTRFNTLTETINNLRSQLSSVENRLPASFKQVAFTARFSTDNADNGIRLNPGQVLKFDAVVTNIGSGYSPQTGIFTAPVAGVYAFFLRQMGTNTHRSVYLEIAKHGTALDRGCRGSRGPGGRSGDHAPGGWGTGVGAAGSGRRCAGKLVDRLYRVPAAGRLACPPSDRHVNSFHPDALHQEVDRP